MADADPKAAHPPAPAPAPQKKKRSKKPLLLAIGVLNVVAIGGVAYGVVAAQKPHAAPAADGHEEHAEAEHGDAKEEAAEEGHGEEKKEAKGEHDADPDERPKPRRGGKGAKGDDGPDDGKGTIATLEPFVVNLDQAETPRFLKVGIDLEVVGADAGAKVKAKTARVRDTILGYLSGLTPEQTKGPLGKSEMRYGIKTKVNEALGEDLVRRVYFTQFIVQ